MPRPHRSQILELFERSVILNALGEEAREGLVGRVTYEKHDAGHVIFTKGSDGRSMLIVVSGRVKVSSTSPRTGNELILNLIEPGDVVGEMALLDGKPRSADAIAAAETETLSLHRPDFLAALRQSPAAAERMMEVLCARLRQATTFVEDALLLDARARLFNRLLGLAEQYAAPNNGTAIRIEHGLSQRELGESVGLTRVSVNRQLADWRKQQLIEDGRGYTVITDLAALKADALSAR